MKYEVIPNQHESSLIQEKVMRMAIQTLVVESEGTLIITRERFEAAASALIDKHLRTDSNETEIRFTIAEDDLPLEGVYYHGIEDEAVTE